MATLKAQLNLIFATYNDKGVGYYAKLMEQPAFTSAGVLCLHRVIVLTQGVRGVRAGCVVVLWYVWGSVGPASTHGVISPTGIH